LFLERSLQVPDPPDEELLLVYLELLSHTLTKAKEFAGKLREFEIGEMNCNSILDSLFGSYIEEYPSTPLSVLSFFG